MPKRNDKRCLVFGNGPSVLDFAPYEFDCVTIGVNIIAKAFHPTFVVCGDPPKSFSKKDSWWVLQSSRFSTLLVPRENQTFWRQSRAHAKAFEMLKDDWDTLPARWAKHESVIPYGLTSPELAIGVALAMGKRDIGLIGVDYTEGHLGDPRPLGTNLAKAEIRYTRLRGFAESVGAKVTNLSPKSRLAAFDMGTPG